MNRLTCWIAAALALAGSGVLVVGAAEVVQLDDIDVKARGVQPAWSDAAGGSVAWALDDAPGVLLNSQGGPSGQTDLSIRGSSFSGAGLSLGGLGLRNPQTEHFHAELPVPAALFAAPGILTGIDQLLASSGHLVGSVGLELLPVTARGYLDVGVGEGDWYWLDGLYEQPLSFGEFGGGVGLFGNVELADGMDWSDNDLERRSGGTRLSMAREDLQMDLLVAGQEKRFGARGYYGVRPDWRAEESLDDLLVFASAKLLQPRGGYLRASALWRELRDQYLLYWPLPGVFENRHRTRVSQAAIDGRYVFSSRWALTWRVDGESEDIDSSNLGKRSRERGAIMVLPECSFGDATLFAGMRGAWFSGQSEVFLPQAGGQYEPAEDWRLFASYTETVRQPSYTELNYESPGSLGDAGLARQEAGHTEAGCRVRAGDALDVQFAVFHRRSRHTVDWVKESEQSARWVATDLGTVETVGVEVAGDWRVTNACRLGLGYTWLHKDVDMDVYGARYVLDHPRHLVQISGEWRTCRYSRFVFSQTWRWQEDLPLRGNDDFGSDASCSAHMTAPGVEGSELSVGIDNAWNDGFGTYIDQPSGDRRVWMALTHRWP